MECIVPDKNIKVWGRALQALAKVGDELFLEAKKDKFSLTTLNNSKTVCASFEFCDTFFSSYDINEDKTVSCKIHMKIFLPLFKNQLERKLEYIKLEYAPDGDFLTFKMKYKSDDILMVHKLRLMDPETLTLGISPKAGCNKLRASSSFYTQMLVMFSGVDDELYFDINQAKVIARNYSVGTSCQPKRVRTQINLNATEFLLYKILKDTVLCFSFKPLRTVVHFAENFNLDIDFNFEVGGKPASLVLQDPTYEVSFVVATMGPDSDGNSSVVSVDNVAKGKVLDLNADVHNWESSLSKETESSFGEMLEQVRQKATEPESPRRKIAKTVFGRCYDNTFYEVAGEKLVGNSDSE